jgi:DNA polymerase I-like protein with 3'-5' exonuclease and polymerase domains
MLSVQTALPAAETLQTIDTTNINDTNNSNISNILVAQFGSGKHSVLCRVLARLEAQSSGHLAHLEEQGVQLDAHYLSITQVLSHDCLLVPLKGESH